MLAWLSPPVIRVHVLAMFTVRLIAHSSIMVDHEWTPRQTDQ